MGRIYWDRRGSGTRRETCVYEVAAAAAEERTLSGQGEGDLTAAVIVLGLGFGCGFTILGLAL